MGGQQEVDYTMGEQYQLLNQQSNLLMLQTSMNEDRDEIKAERKVDVQNLLENDEDSFDQTLKNICKDLEMNKIESELKINVKNSWI